jgi:serine protease
VEPQHGWTNQQIRDALAATAEDLGSAGRDNTYGWGLVRAKAALDHLNGGGTQPPPVPFTLTVTKSKQKGVNLANLSWSGSTCRERRRVPRHDEARHVSGNTFTDSGLANRSTHTYKVCNCRHDHVLQHVTVTF